MLTYKNRSGLFVRRKLLRNIAGEIKTFLQQHKNTQIIIVHGAGQPGHSIAQKYRLASGVRNNRDKIYGSLLCNAAIEKLDEEMIAIFLKAGLNVCTVDALSVITQKNKKMHTFDTTAIKNALAHHTIPILHGQMVFDNTETLSICSGDTIATYLADHFSAKKLLFASDVDGVLTKDPFVFPHAKLITKIATRDILHSRQTTLSKSHNTDVTDGLLGKIRSLDHLLTKNSVKEVVIFNGLKKERFGLALTDKKFPCTKITLRDK
ncbi:MAG: hypothetical protein A2261_03565 [Candidatus Magasanikbacteria bacterium RIFOXYA2_FULL_44_8]|uniref:Isopentenyl phosphate kinase n=1 Tax=Candidatus Magasanikbacteria bacterium RIFOXYA2_FULL_44_8 TaxID=1798696 RepID=A0A1F6NK00_9BACT|nr:MAG: hypothetical protein A2261_03565 [Candidatus Magasanikbacteria bacterium RIFOXYA2_FULL_44_8]